MANTDALTPEQMLGAIDRSLLELAKSQEAQAKSIKNLSKIINKNFAVVNSSMNRREQRDSLKERRLKSEPQEITLSKKTLMQLKKLDQSERFDALLKEVRKQPKQSEGFFSRILGPIGLLLGGVAALGFGVGKFPLVKQLFQNFQKTGVYQSVTGFLSKFNKSDKVLKEWIRNLPIVGRLIDVYDAFKLIGEGNYKKGLKRLVFAIPGAEFIANLIGIKKEEFIEGIPTGTQVSGQSILQKVKEFFKNAWEKIIAFFTPDPDSTLGKLVSLTKNIFSGKLSTSETLNQLADLFPIMKPVVSFIEEFNKTDIKGIWNEAFKTGGKSRENTELVNGSFSKFISNIADNFAKLSKLLDSVANIFTGVMNYLSANADERAQGEAQLKEHAPDLLTYLQFFRTIAEYIEAANKDGIRGIIKRFFGGPGSQNKSWEDILAKWSQELQIFVRNVFDTIIQVIKDAGDEIVRVLREELQRLIHNAKEKAKDFVREKIPFGEKIVGKKQVEPAAAGPTQLVNSTAKAFQGAIPGSIQGAFTGMVPGLPGAIAGAVKGAATKLFEDKTKKTYESIAAKNKQAVQDKFEGKVAEPVKKEETKQQTPIKETPPEKILAQVKLDNTSAIQTAKLNLKPEASKQVAQILKKVKPTLVETQKAVEQAADLLKDLSKDNPEATKLAEKAAALAEKRKKLIEKSDQLVDKVANLDETKKAADQPRQYGVYDGKYDKPASKPESKDNRSSFQRAFGIDGAEAIKAVTDAAVKMHKTYNDDKKDTSGEIKPPEKEEKITETTKPRDACWDDFCKIMKEQIKLDKTPKYTQAVDDKPRQYGVYDGKYDVPASKPKSKEDRSSFERAFGIDGVEAINALSNASIRMHEANKAKRADTDELIKALDANRQATEELQKLLRSIDMHVQKGNQINDKGFAAAANSDKSTPQLINVNNSSRNVVLNSSNSTNSYRSGMLNSPYAPV